MKNDPHVTEVSDDGALLKRYRNEIVDLKRRLHEASVKTIFFFFLQSCCVRPNTACWMTAARSPL